MQWRRAPRHCFTAIQLRIRNLEADSKLASCRQLLPRHHCAGTRRPHLHHVITRICVTKTLGPAWTVTWVGDAPPWAVQATWVAGSAPHTPKKQMLNLQSIRLVCTFGRNDKILIYMHVTYWGAYGGPSSIRGRKLISYFIKYQRCSWVSWVDWRHACLWHLSMYACKYICWECPQSQSDCDPTNFCILVTMYAFPIKMRVLILYCIYATRCSQRLAQAHLLR